MATVKGKFLTQEEKDLCEKIAALNIELVSHRAQALLLLNDGNTQKKSSELSSLTIGQLRYLLRLFKTQRTNLFPGNLFPQVEEKEIEETPISEVEISGKDVKEVKQKEKQKKKKKGKKGKKGKKPSTKKKQHSKKEGKKKKKK